MAAALVSDARRMQLLHLSDLGSPATAWLGAAGSGDGEFDVPMGLAATGGGRCVAADSGNHRIVAFDADDLGNWRALGARGAGELEFERPSGVAVDGFGRIHVADTGNGRIVRVDDMDGSGWTAYGSRGTPTAADPQAVDRFRAPVAVAVDADGRIWIADEDFSRIVRVDDLTGTGWLARGAGVPTAVAAEPPDRMLVAELAGRAVTRRDGDSAVALDATAAGLLGGPAALCPDGADVAVLDSVSARVVVLDGLLDPAPTPVFLGDFGARAPIGMCLL
jgi:streptogramin lyase